MATRRFFLFAIIFALLILIVPLYGPGSTPKVQPEDLMGMIGDGTAPALLDVRTKAEYEKGHLPRAIHASVFALVYEHKELAVSHQEDLIVYCGTGIRAKVAALILKAAGFNSVYMLDGQLKHWKGKGYPLVVA